MSIRLLAQDLYRLIKEVEKLEKAVEAAPFEKKKSLEERLRKMKAERDYVRGLLDGRKEG